MSMCRSGANHRRSSRNRKSSTAKRAKREPATGPQWDLSLRNLLSSGSTSSPATLSYTWGSNGAMTITVEPLPLSVSDLYQHLHKQKENVNSRHSKWDHPPVIMLENVGGSTHSQWKVVTEQALLVLQSVSFHYKRQHVSTCLIPGNVWTCKRAKLLLLFLDSIISKNIMFLRG